MNTLTSPKQIDTYMAIHLSRMDKIVKCESIQHDEGVYSFYMKCMYLLEIMTTQRGQMTEHAHTLANAVVELWTLKGGEGRKVYPTLAEECAQ